MTTIEITNDTEGMVLVVLERSSADSTGVVVMMTPAQARDAGEKLFRAGCMKET